MLSNFKWQYLPGEPIFKKPAINCFLSLVSLLKTNKQYATNSSRNIYQAPRGYSMWFPFDVFFPQSDYMGRESLKSKEHILK
jgi:hypothetical protein